MRRNAVLSVMVALTGLTFAAHDTLAQGFGVYEHDACMMGRAGTGVAAPCSNASAIFVNPAGLVNAGAAQRWNVSAGLTLISPSFTYQDSLTATTTNGVDNTIPVPNLYVVRQLGRFAHRYPWAVGIGVFAPYGLVSEWPSDFQGRFLGYRSELKSVNIQPTAAWQINHWLSFGAGFDYVRTTVDLKQRVDLSSNPVGSPLLPPGTTFAALGVPVGTDFADGHLTGASWSGTGHFGLLVTTDRVNVGVRYLMRGTADIQGDANFSQVATGILLPAGSPLQPAAKAYCPGVSAPDDTLRAAAGLPLDDVLHCGAFSGSGPLTSQHASVPIALPDQLILGTSIQATEKLRLLMDVQWVHWERFKELRLTFAKLPQRVLWEDYHNTTGVRLGAEYALMPKFTVRVGGLYHEGAAPAQTVTPLLPEAERSEATFGGTLHLGRNGQLDFAYQRIWQADRRGRVVEPTVRGSAGTAVNTGLYGGSATLLGANLSWRF